MHTRAPWMLVAVVFFAAWTSILPSSLSEAAAIRTSEAQGGGDAELPVSITGDGHPLRSLRIDQADAGVMRTERMLPFRWVPEEQEQGVVPQVQGAVVSSWDGRQIIQGGAAPALSPGIAPGLRSNNRVDRPRVPPIRLGFGRTRERGLCSSTRFAAPLSFSVEASLPSSIAIADLNNDKKVDLVAPASGSDVVVVFLGRGDGTFDRGRRYPVGPPGSRPTSVRLADMNMDGRLDILTSNLGGGTVSVLLGRGDGTFIFGRPFSTGMSAAPTNMAVGDFNGDGIPDTVTAHTKSRTLNVLFGDDNSDPEEAFNNQYELACTFLSIVCDVCQGTGGFRRATTVGLGPCKHKKSYPLAVESANLNKHCEKKLRADDIIVGLPGEVAILRSLGDGTFQAPTFHSIGEGALPTQIALGYVNHDHILDIVTADGPVANTISVFLGRGDRRFSSSRSFNVRPGLAPHALALADVNGDLRTDVITANAASNDVTVLTGGGDGTFSVARTFPVDGSGVPGPVAVVAALIDDCDCMADIAVAHMSAGSISVLLNSCTIVK